MRQLEIEFCELHGPLFLAGTNLQLKLDPSKRHGLRLVYDRDEKELHVWWNGKSSIVPLSNVSSMVPTGGIPFPDDNLLTAIKEKYWPVAPTTPIKAQVGSPQDHVFAGPGHGKTGK